MSCSKCGRLSFYALPETDLWEEYMHRLSSSAAAVRRLTEIEAEMARIVAVFPELRRTSGIPLRLRLGPRGRRRAKPALTATANRHA